MRGRTVDIEVLDTTLRDGAQTSGVTFTLQEKLNIAKKLDELGVSYIEGGWPGSNPKDISFFKEAKKLELENSEVVAFGSTKRSDMESEEDPNVRALVDSDVDTAVVFGKSWKLHVTDVLKTTVEKNLECVSETVRYLRGQGMQVIFDAEHFFDGYKDSREHAMNVVKAAEEAGARTVVLCDTNGGTLTHELSAIVTDVRAHAGAPLGIHTHNDSGLATANTLVAVVNGARHVQGTMNGLGERCGNADLVEIVPSLELKLGLTSLKSGGEEGLKLLSATSSYVYDLLNIAPDPSHPYVGARAFAHKGGVHVDAVMKNSRAYEHIDPSRIGNSRRLLVSELAGKAAVINEALKLGLKFEKQNQVVVKTLEEVKKLESRGHFLESADASIHMMLYRNMGVKTDFFELLHWTAMARKHENVITEGQVIVRSGPDVSYAEASGVGPVHAMDLALRKALVGKFPVLSNTVLSNYKVTVVDGERGTASMVRVFIEFSDDGRRWGTTSASENILEASAQALVDGYNYRLLLEEAGRAKEKTR